MAWFAPVSMVAVPDAMTVPLRYACTVAPFAETPTSSPAAMVNVPALTPPMSRSAFRAPVMSLSWRLIAALPVDPVRSRIDVDSTGGVTIFSPK